VNVASPSAARGGIVKTSN